MASSDTVRDSLVAARDNYAAQLEELSKSPKVTYSVDGRSFSWTEYQVFLIDKIRELASMIDDENEEGIVEEISQFYT